MAQVLARHQLLERVESPIRIRDDITWGTRLAAAVRELGPAFVVFGHYLSRRPDILPLAESLALGELAPGDADLGALDVLDGGGEELLARLAVELDRPAESYFAEIDAKPTYTGFLRVEFSARLRAGAGESVGRDVVLRLPRPGVAAVFGQDGSFDESAAELALLRPAFALVSVQPADVDRLLGGFRAWLGHRRDLRAEALGLRRLAEGLVDNDAVRIPEFAPLLCTAGLSVRQDLRGSRLRALRDASLPPSQSVHGELLRKLHLADLEQMLLAGEAVHDSQWEELPDGNLALVAGRCEQLASASLPRLWSYLQHVVGHRPEDAWSAIRGELRPMQQDADERSLRLALRQVVPFRDGGWTERRDTVAELLVLHWRLIHDQGFEPSPALRALYASVEQVAAVGRALRLEGDPLRGAIEDLRWLSSWRRLRALADPHALGEAMEQNLAGFLEMPQKIDRLLDLATSDGEGLHLRAADRCEPRAESRRRDRRTLALCLGLLMAAVVLVAGRLADAGLAPSGLSATGAWLGGWLEPLLAAVFLGLGGLLLRSLLR